MVPYKPGFDKIGNPHKMMEYLGSGRPILSTRLREYAELSNWIIMEDGVDSFIRALGVILQAPDDEDGKEQRRGFALKHTYERQVYRVLDMLGDF